MKVSEIYEKKFIKKKKDDNITINKIPASHYYCSRTVILDERDCKLKQEALRWNFLQQITNHAVK